jgi:DNA polymerase kappa
MEQAPEQPHHVLSLNTNKGGMGGVDKGRAEAIINKMSAGSEFYKRQAEKRARTEKRAEEMARLASALTDAQRAALRRDADARAEALEAQRDDGAGKVWVCVDFDAFFVNAELLDRPDLEGKPVAVGGMSMLSTANYVARSFGVRAAMPGYIGKALCPELVILPMNFHKYKAIAAAAREIFEQYDPLFESHTLDEALLEVSGCLADRAREQQGLTAEALVAELRGRVSAATRLTVSAGIGCNRMIAKMASEEQKPNGQFAVGLGRGATLAYLWAKPTRKVPFIGEVTSALLAALGMDTVGDMFEKRELLLHCFPAVSASHLLEISLGISATEHSDPATRPYQSGMSRERTVPVDTLRDATALVARLADLLAEDLAGSRAKGRHLTLKLKTKAFRVLSRSEKLPGLTADKTAIARAATDLLKATWEEAAGVGARLLGLKIADLKYYDEAGREVDTAPPVRADGQTSILGHLKRSGVEEELGLEDDDDEVVVEVEDKDEDEDCQVVVVVVGSSSSSKVCCPVCNKAIQGNNAVINAHVNSCLSKPPEQASPPRKRGQATLESLWRKKG